MSRMIIVGPHNENYSQKTRSVQELLFAEFKLVLRGDVVEKKLVVVVHGWHDCSESKFYSLASPTDSRWIFANKPRLVAPFYD